jgi:hypothetical protein
MTGQRTANGRSTLVYLLNNEPRERGGGGETTSRLGVLGCNKDAFEKNLKIYPNMSRVLSGVLMALPYLFYK